MRDEGLNNSARQISDADALATLASSLDTPDADSFEALYEVFGFDRTNFGGELVYSWEMDTRVIWETRLKNQ